MSYYDSDTPDPSICIHLGLYTQLSRQILEAALSKYAPEDHSMFSFDAWRTGKFFECTDTWVKKSSKNCIINGIDGELLFGCRRIANDANRNEDSHLHCTIFAITCRWFADNFVPLGLAKESWQDWFDGLKQMSYEDLRKLDIPGIMVHGRKILVADIMLVLEQLLGEHTLRDSCDQKVVDRVIGIPRDIIEANYVDILKEALVKEVAGDKYKNVFCPSWRKETKEYDIKKEYARKIEDLKKERDQKCRDERKRLTLIKNNTKKAILAEAKRKFAEAGCKISTKELTQLLEDKVEYWSGSW